MTTRTKKELPDSLEIELRPDGWARFTSAVKAAAKSGPKHRPRQNKPKELVAAKSNK